MLLKTAHTKSTASMRVNSMAPQNRLTFRVMKHNHFMLHFARATLKSYGRASEENRSETDRILSDPDFVWRPLRRPFARTFRLLSFRVQVAYRTIPSQNLKNRTLEHLPRFSDNSGPVQASKLRNTKVAEAALSARSLPSFKRKWFQTIYTVELSAFLDEFELCL